MVMTMNKNSTAKVVKIDAPSPDQLESVNRLLREHNQTSNPDYWEAITGDNETTDQIQLFALNSDDEIIGGLFGETYFRWLKVNILVVRSDQRGLGIGTMLLSHAEEIAAEKECQYAYADTMEYQAPTFYEKAGYQCKGTLEDWDSYGHKKFFFTKNLKKSNLASEK